MTRFAAASCGLRMVGVNAAKLSGLLHTEPARFAFDFLAAMHQY